MPDVRASDIAARFPTKPDLAQERRRAKDLLKAVRRGDDAAIARFRAHHPRLAELTPGQSTSDLKLSDAQWVIAREYGFASWLSLKAHIEQMSGRPPGVVPYSVVIWNDDTTPMEFVIWLLKQVFGKSEQDAVRIMLDIHYAEFAVCAAFDRLEEAEAKRAEATALVRRHGHALEVTCARVDVATTTTLRHRVENSNEFEARARQVRCDDTAMYVELIDGRTLSAPLAWFPRLLHASPDQRRRCALSDQGRELSWEFGVRVSVSGLLAGRGRETVIGPASRLSSLTASALASMPVPVRSVADCHDALAACNRQDAPLAWSRAQTDLGYALFSLHGGPTNTDTARIAEAVAAYRAALEECTRERAPLDWARLQRALGLALQVLGGHRNDPAMIEAAVLAFRAALSEKARLPLPERVHACESLGNALRDLGAREAGTVRLDEAVVAFGEALGDLTREQSQFHWAAITFRMADALSLLAERRGDSATAERAVTQLSIALEIMRKHEPQPQPLVTLCADQLAKARAFLDQLSRR
jgi:ATP-dependent Clp protease adapter protein ClpS/tetratricopeptide (TPR) repeat protein